MTVGPEDVPAQPWSPRDATERIREIAGGTFELILTRHARDQLNERQLIVGDATHVLKYGHVYDAAEPSTRLGFCKYQMESRSPNSNSRTLRVVVVPSAREKRLKIITVMWKD